MKNHLNFLCPLMLLAFVTLTTNAQDKPADEVAAPTITPIMPEPKKPEADILETPEIDGSVSNVEEGTEANAQDSEVAVVTDEKTEVEATPEGFILKDAALNEIFQFLAKSAGRQYFHNIKISGPEFVVTGHLGDGDPLSQMDELAFMFGLSLHTKGNTVYALTKDQLSQLPGSEWHYQLKYLRPTDIKQIEKIIKDMLTPSTGIVNFEPKTNTVIIIDTATRIESARRLLYEIDKPKGQIIVGTKILRINSSAGEKLGVNWADTLGNLGVPLQTTGQIGNLFGIPTSFDNESRENKALGDFTPKRGSIILTPVQLSGVLKALNEGGISNQVSNPTLITEDNEQATISIIDRIPIITSTTTPGTAGVQPTVTEEVRYKIDTSDKAITEDPDNHREIGISISVTPTLLPDGTIRMKMRPRSAQITGTVEGVGVAGLDGNSYPRVTESMIETLARIPDGDSLIVGGFYGEVQNNDKNKVPLFGDIPVLNFFFKSKETSKEQTSLVFIVTPSSYNPTDNGASERVSAGLKKNSDLPNDYDSIDPYNPGPAHEPNLLRTVRGMQPSQAPYYPRAEDLNETSEPSERSKPRFSRARRH